jgi:Holliday junction resolvase-like predicted endonuclease
MAKKDPNGQAAEDAVAAELRANGWDVLNLNREIAGNYPKIDLIARRGAARMLIQVRGCGDPHGKFPAPSVDARKVETLGDWLGRPALYAFVHSADETPVTRYETASRVADLAEKDEANCPGINYYHVHISQFDSDIKHLRQLLRGLRRRQFLRNLRKLLGLTD